MNESNSNLISSSTESRMYDTFNIDEDAEVWEDNNEARKSTASSIEMRPRNPRKPKILFSPKKITTRFSSRSPKKVKSTSSGIILSSRSAASFNSRPRTKSISSFGRLTSFMTGSPRPPIKYSSRFKTNTRNRKATKVEEDGKLKKTHSVDSSYKDDISLNTNTENNTTRGSMVIAPQAAVDAARLALAARAEYAKKYNSECLEKGTFYIVVDDKSKNELVGKLASPGQLEDIGNQLLEEVQRLNDENSLDADSELTNLEFTKVISSSKSKIHKKSRSKGTRKPSFSGKKTKTFESSQISINSKSSFNSHQSDVLTPNSDASDANQSNLLLPGIPSLRLHIPSLKSTKTNPFFQCDTNTANEEFKSTALTTNSTTINTPEDFISYPSPAEFHNKTKIEMEPMNKFIFSSETELRKQIPTRLESKSKKLKRNSKNSSIVTINEKKKDLFIKLNQNKNVQQDSIQRLSSTASSVFERNGSSYVPFTQENPITTTSANSKPVSPVSLAIAGVVMLSGTCAFVVSFALGKQGNWTLAASVIMGLGAVAVFCGLCWYLAHTSAPSAQKNNNSNGLEIKVVDRKQLENLMKKGVCFESVNNASIA